MEKEVLITIGGTMFAGDDKDNVDVITPGQYYYRRGRHYITYEDMVEDTRESIRNLVWISPEEMVVRKSGAITTEMIFRPNEETLTHYNTPFGAVEMGIHTKRLQIQESDEKLLVKVHYTLELDYQIVSENQLTFLVQPRKNGKIGL